MRTTVVVILFCCVSRVVSRPARIEENDAEDDYEANNEGPGAEITREDDESREPMANMQEPEVGDNQRFREDVKRMSDLRSELRSEDELPQAAEEEGSEDVDDVQEETEDEQPLRRRYSLPESYKGGLQNKKIDEEPIDETILSNSLNSVARAKQHQTNKYLKNNDELEMDQQPVKNRETKSVQSDRKDGREEAKKKKRVSDIKGTFLEGGELLFGNNENNVDPQEKDKSGYNNNDPAEPREQERYFKNYYNTMQAEHRGNMPDKSYENHYNFNRDRREIDSKSKDDDNAAGMNNETNENEPLSNPSTENEEAAIKRHVKKLSSKELEELLSSLSEDKRELLKKIMSNDAEFSVDNINKREITKKSGAAATDDNSFLEGGQLDVSKFQDGSSSGESIGDSQQSTGAIQNSKQSETTEMTELAIAKSTSPGSTFVAPDKADLSENTDHLKQEKSKNDVNLVEANKDQANNNGQPSMKIEIKREATIDLPDIDMSCDDGKLVNNFDAQESSNEQGYNMCPQDDEFSEIIDDDSQLHNADGNSMKREVADLSESMKSLEESFPNSNAYDDGDPYAGTMLAPLVRVKRKNTDLAMKKRAVALSPSNVAYFPYRAENDDEDNDEGNEFDDDGFFDRTSNLAKSNLKVKVQEELHDDIDTLKHIKYTKTNNMNRSKNSQVENMESDTMSLGSDTDGVISGVEGVDDNLMYNSASRNKRSEEGSKTDEKVDDAEPKINRSMRSTPIMDDEVQTVSENISAAVANYQENDAFGSLPRSYEGELTRYKRIRRVKQIPNQDIASSDT